MNVLKANHIVMREPLALSLDRPITLHDLYSIERMDGFKKIEVVNKEWYLTEEAYYSRPDFHTTLVQTKLMVALGMHIRSNKLGRLLSGSLGFVLEGHHNAIQLMRRTELAFVRKEKLAVNIYEPYYSAPELAVHIQSNHLPEEMFRRINDFLRHGTKQVWHVLPQSQQIAVHLPDQKAKTYGINDTIDGGDLLKGLRLNVSQVFES